MNNIKILIVLLSFTLAVQAQTSFQPFVDSLAKAYMKNLTGSLVIGIHDNGKEKIFYYGETATGNNQKPDSNSIFEIGGITETFTSVLYADMGMKGIIGPDDPVSKYLPLPALAMVYREIICVPDKNYKKDPVDQNDGISIHFTPYICYPSPSAEPQPILLCYLATNTSGLPHKPFNLKKYKSNPYVNYSKEDLYHFLQEYKFDKPIGFDYKPSPLGIALLGHVLCLKTNQSYDKLLTDYLLNPLNMFNTSTTLTEAQNKYFVEGHNCKGKAVEHWTYDVYAPAGALHSSIGDMMKFLSANINPKKDSIVNLLDYTHNPRMKLNDRKRKDAEIALGWKINSIGVEEKRMVWQDGLTGGFGSFIGFVETNHTGVIILSAVSKNVNTIGIEILKQLALKKL